MILNPKRKMYKKSARQQPFKKIIAICTSSVIMMLTGGVPNVISSGVPTFLNYSQRTHLLTQYNVIMLLYCYIHNHYRSITHTPFVSGVSAVMGSGVPSPGLEFQSTSSGVPKKLVHI